jgi:hypothetical protein
MIKRLNISDEFITNGGAVISLNAENVKLAEVKSTMPLQLPAVHRKRKWCTLLKSVLPRNTLNLVWLLLSHQTRSYKLYFLFNMIQKINPIKMEQHIHC